MTQKDQQKVLNKGFTIIRADYFRMSIKYKNVCCHEWKTLEKGFKTKAALESKMKALLEDPTYIED